MINRVNSLFFHNFKPIKVQIEVNAHRGIPGLHLIGLASKSVTEASDRITSSLYYSGIRIKAKKVVVNLAPAELRKTSPILDLGIAIGLLRLYEPACLPLADTVYVGELALDGQLKPMTSALATGLAAKELGFKKIVFPAADFNQLKHISDIELYPLHSLQEGISWHKNGFPLPSYPETLPTIQHDMNGIFDSIIGQDQAKRALCLSAVGKHHLLLTGSPGIGKTLLSQALVELLPPLSEAERLNIGYRESLLLDKLCLSNHRPYRTPPTTLTRSRLVGSVGTFMPGEIDMADHGVLCLNELPEFSSNVLEGLRQPLDQLTGETSDTADQSSDSDFILFATANPCPCGYLNNQHQGCICTQAAITRYQKKLSGPIADRIDIHLFLDQEDTQILATNHLRLDQVKPKIHAAIRRQNERYKPYLKTAVSRLSKSELEASVRFSAAAKSLLQEASRTLHLSWRGYFKTLAIAQTISDFEAAERIELAHMAEALQYRPRLELKRLPE